MKKLLLGILLVAVLGAVVYLQINRDSDKRTTAFRKGYRAGVDSLQSSQPDFDSVAQLLAAERQALAEYKTAMADSLLRRDSLYAQTVDSLADKIQAQKTDIGKLKQKTLATKTPASTAKGTSAAPGGGASHQEILSHYKAAMAKLPGDLSAYEYQVAVTEVRTETAAKYRISIDRLNEIRKANQIDF
jgi:gas vesicle protein